jgi:hypothetical protein
MSILLALGVVGLVLALVLLFVLAGRFRPTGRRPEDDAGEFGATPSSGPMYGVRHIAGSDFAPQPVFGLNNGGSMRLGRGGAHRRESDADEIARLDALRQSGELSDDEFATLKARIG